MSATFIVLEIFSPVKSILLKPVLQLGRVLMKGSEEKVYACEDCGACCRCYPIFALESDAEREPRIREAGVRCDDFLGEKGQIAYRLFPLFRKEACVFLKEDQLCRIYESRPEACRKFEPGGEQCREARRRAGVGGKTA